jgi:hypothetical protein
MNVRYIEDLDYFERKGKHEFENLTDGKEYYVVKEEQGKNYYYYWIVDDSGGKPNKYKTEIFELILYACPCCGRKTLPERNNYEICETCFWEDELISSPDEPSAANNDYSLNDYRANWIIKKSHGIANHFDYERASTYSRYNREELEKDKVCGCYYCCEIYDTSEINEWCLEDHRGEEVTAICPRCEIDSVISESSGYPMTKEFFQKMHKFAFSGVDCPVCGDCCFAEEGDFDVCGNCGWINDPVQFKEHDSCDGVNELSVNHAKAEWDKEQEIRWKKINEEREAFYRAYNAREFPFED